MVFANLFTSLSAVEDADTQRSSTCSKNASDQEGRGKAGKRKISWDESGLFPKKQRYQNVNPRTNQSAGYNFTIQCQNSKTFSKHASQNGSDSIAGNRICLNDNSKNKSNGNKRKVQANKNFDRPSNKGWSRNNHRPGFTNNGGKRKRDNQERPRFMTQEFKEQNALEVDGQLLCRHFVMGKCIKGDDCQLKHVPGYNDLIKMSCKFYIQGFCLKGDNCPYMHKSFPCRFFHRGARCLQEANCRFSHDPLTDLSSKLLDEAIKRDRELQEQARAAEQRPAGSSVDTEQSDVFDTNKLPDFFLQPLRPNFYKNSDADKTVDESPTCQSEDLKSEPTLDSNKSEQVDSVEAHSPPVAKPDSPEPVCYSVEAVLGSQRFKPSTHAFTFPGSKEFAPLSSSMTSNLPNQTQALYSVDTGLTSLKSIEDSNYGLKKAPYTQTVSYTPIKAGEDACPPKSSQTTRLAKEHNKVLEKSPTSLTLSEDLNSNSLKKPSQAFRDPKQQHKEGWMSSTSAQSFIYEVELDKTSHGHSVVKEAEKSSMLSRERALLQVSIPKADAQSSLKSFSSKFAVLKNPSKVSASVAGCNTPPTKTSEPATEDKNTKPRLFQSLFKAPLAGNPLPVVDSTISSSTNRLAVLAGPALNSPQCQSEHFRQRVETVAAGSSPSFPAAPADASVSLLDNSLTGSLEVHRPSNPERSKAGEKSSNLQAKRQNSHKCANQPPAHQETAALSDGKQPSNISSQKDTKAAPARSVFKTLFQSLRPFQQDCGNSATSECEDQSNCQVQTESRANGALGNRTETDTVGLQSIEEMSEGHRGTETLHGLTRISAEETNRPSISSRAGPSCQQRDQDKHPSPVGTTPRASFHIGPAEKSKAKRAACADATPFRNLFKTFSAQGR